jgi:hypothetical protein
MSYTEAELNYYKKNPSHITADLAEDLLLELIDTNASWFEYIKDNHTLELATAAYQKDPSTFKYINREILTPQFLEEVIENNPMMIQYVYMPSSELIKRALLKDLNVLQYLRRIPEEIYLWLLPQNGLVLEHIQAGEQTEEMVRLAIHENYEAYKYSHIKTLEFDQYIISKDPSRMDLVSEYHPELIEAIIEYNPRYISKFFDMPEIITDEIKRRAIELDYQVYRLLPESMIDMSLMKFAVEQELSLLDYMPYSQELIDHAINVNGLALQYVKKKDLRTIRRAIDNNVLALDFVEYPRQFLIDYAFKVDGYALKYIENPTAEQMLDAVQRNGFAIEWIAPEDQTKAIQMYALAGAGTKAIPFIPNPADDEVTLQMIRLEPAYIFRIDEPTDAMYTTAFQTTGQLILFYPDWEDKFDDTIVASALTQDGTILEKVRDVTKTLVMAALDSFPSALQWVKYQDLEMAYKAVEADPRTLFFVDKNIMDEDLLNLALELDPEYFTRTEGEMTWEQWLEVTGQA